MLGVAVGGCGGGGDGGGGAAVYCTVKGLLDKFSSITLSSVNSNNAPLVNAPSRSC